MSSVPKARVINQDREGAFSVRISNMDRSSANAIRRTIHTHIDQIVLSVSDKEKEEWINMTNNHNEILELLLSKFAVSFYAVQRDESAADGIVVNSTFEAMPALQTPDLQKELAILPGNYEIVVEATNETNKVITVTTEHFKIRKIGANRDLEKSAEIIRALFPPVWTFNHHSEPVSFAAPLCDLPPKFANETAGKTLKIKLQFKAVLSGDNGCYTVASNIAVVNVLDESSPRVKDEIKAKKALIENDSTNNSREEKDRLLADFDILAKHKQEYAKENVCNFLVVGIGAYEKKSKYLLQRAVEVLIDQLDEIIKNQFNTVERNLAYSDTRYSFRFTNRTLGALISAHLNNTYCERDVESHQMLLCVHEKQHPSKNDTFLSVAYVEDTIDDKNTLFDQIQKVCEKIQQEFRNLAASLVPL